MAITNTKTKAIPKKKKSKSSAYSSVKSIKALLAWLYSYQQELVGGVLLGLMVLTLLSLFSITGGSFSYWWASFFSKLFGWGAIPTATMLAILGGLLILPPAQTSPSKDRGVSEGWDGSDVVIGLELMLVVGLSFTHLILANNANSLALARAGEGGGFIGWGVSSLLSEIAGPVVAGLILLLFGLAALGLILRLTLNNAKERAALLYEWGKRLGKFLYLGMNYLKNKTAMPLLAKESSWPVFNPTQLEKLEMPDSIMKKRSANGQTDLANSKSVQVIPPSLLSEAEQLALKLAGSSHADDLSKQIAKSVVAVMPKRRYPLPSLSLLTVSQKDLTYNPNAKVQAKIIEETLFSFSVPAEVVEINAGPTVTQFGLKLGTVERKMTDGSMGEQRIRVRKVIALSDDLALALSASPIRIEAPVPGRPLVGIEVPNLDKSMVPMRDVLESKIFQRSEVPLRVALGRGVSGEPMVASLMQMPHLLIAGATGSGKSVCINSLISALLFTHSPEQLRLLMIDPKMVELTCYNGIPHLIAPVVTDFEQVVGALAWGTREMEQRYQLFAKMGARSINSYNQKVENKDEQLPYVVIIIDELADLMMLAPDEVERYICRMAQMARATGIHLVIATQRPSVDVITGLIKANFPARIAFAVASQIDSRVILDSPGAEKLLGQGDMLYLAPDSSKLTRLQGCYISDTEIQNLVNYWKQATRIQQIEQPDKTDKLPWADLMAENEKDDMLEEAIKIVVEGQRASTSLLQRRLGVGYPRASRMMDQLEKEGVIGPSEGSKPREVFWPNDKDVTDYPELKEDINS